MLLHASGPTVHSTDHHHKPGVQTILRSFAPERRSWRCASLSESLKGRKQLAWEVQEPKLLPEDEETEIAEEEVLESGRSSGQRKMSETSPLPHQDSRISTKNWQGDVPHGYALKNGDLVKDSSCMQHGMRWYILRVASKQQKYVVEYLEEEIPKLPALEDENGKKIARQYSVWSPQKKIRVWNPRTKKMGRKTVDYVTTPRVLLECAMDNHMFNLIKEAPLIIGFVDVNLQMDWVPNPCEDIVIKDIWDWIWRNDDIDEQEYLKRRDENEYAKYAVEDDSSQVYERDIVDIVELLTVGKNVEENEEEFLKKKAQREEKQRERHFRRLQNKDPQRRPRSGRSMSRSGARGARKERHPPASTRNYTAKEPTTKRQEPQRRTSSNSPRPESTQDYDSPWQKWEEPTTSPDLWGADSPDNDNSLFKRDDRELDGKEPNPFLDSPKTSIPASKRESSSPRAETGKAPRKSPVSKKIDKDFDMTSFFVDEPAEAVEVQGKPTSRLSDTSDLLQGLDDVPVTRQPDASDLLQGLDAEHDDDLLEFTESLNKLNVISSMDDSPKDTSSSKNSALDDFSSLDEIDELLLNQKNKSSFTNNPRESTKKTGEPLAPLDSADNPLPKDNQVPTTYRRAEKPRKALFPAPADDKGMHDKVPSPAKHETVAHTDDPPPHVDKGITAGDRISVLSGSFKDFEGKVLSGGKGGGMEVELDIFGRPTIVEIEESSLKKK